MIKIVAVIVVIIMFVRIDLILSYFDRAAEKLDNKAAEVQDTDIRSDTEVIPVSQDANLKQTPKKVFLSLLEAFHASPVSDIRERAMKVLKDHPTLFGVVLDKELESHVFMWRDLLINNDKEVVNFILELQGSLQGENLEMLKKFFALWMDINMDHFLAAYVRAKDPNCMIITTFGDTIPEEEKLNEYYDREDALKAFMAKEKVDPAQKLLAEGCLLVLGLEIQKVAPKPSGEASPETLPEAQSSTTITPAPAEGTIP